MLHLTRDPRDRFTSVIARWKSNAYLPRERMSRYRDRCRVVQYGGLGGELEAICPFAGAPIGPEMEGAPEFRRQGSSSSCAPRRAGVVDIGSICRCRDVLSASQIHCNEGRLYTSPAHSDHEMDADPTASYLHGTYSREIVGYGGWWVRHARRSRRGVDVPDDRLAETDPEEAS